MLASPAGSVVVTQDGSQMTLTLGEGIDHSAALEILEAARSTAQRDRAIVVDCSGPEFLPTAVVQILTALKLNCLERGVAFAVEGVQESAAATLRLAGLDSILRS